MQSDRKQVLITGASSGIGRVTALHLVASDLRVFAACRRAEDGAALQAEAGVPDLLVPVMLDVTRPDTIAASRAFISAETGGRLDALVNNAGIGLSVPMEVAPLDAVRTAFEVNVFGQLAVIQAFLPLLPRGTGRIVNVGSVGAHITIPFGGVLCGSKAAFESFSDALRMELRPLGIHVAIIQPGSIKTPAVDKTLGGVEAAISRWPESGRARYAALFRRFSARANAREADGSDPDIVARTIHLALTTPQPQVRYPTGKDAHLLTVLPRLLPDRLLDFLRLKMFGLPTGFGEERERP